MIAVNVKEGIRIMNKLFFVLLICLFLSKIVYTNTTKYGYYHRETCCSLYGTIYNSMTEEDAKKKHMLRCERCLP